MKVLFALLFTIVLPVGTAIWSEHVVIDAPRTPMIPGWLSISIAVVGAVLVVWSMLLLRIKGKGLPMTIAPPEILVTTGPYALLRHPIYVGVVITWIGISLWHHYSGMFWIGTPTMILGMWSIVNGYERHHHDRHFSGARTMPLLVFPRLSILDTLWRRMLQGADRIANSWTEWQIGRFRLINHGLYAGAATLVGMLIVVLLLPASAWVDILIIAVSAVFGAGLWAQIVEGNSGLLRPFGFYGSVVGGNLALLVLALLGHDSWVIAAAFGTAAPWFQGIGRCRCLVQGCCHGAPHPGGTGLHYHMPKSRVTAAGLADVPLYATPVYSMMSNLLVAAPVLFWCWSQHLPASFILGVSFLLNSVARFVEEAFRGEPQTPTYWGLRLYQWVALAAAVIGMGLMMVPSPRVAIDATISIDGVIVAVVLALFTTIAMGVDSPTGTTRFSRLTP